MPGRKFSRMMEVTCYEDDDGNPTCAIDFSTGDVCVFYRTMSFGCKETCVFAEDTGRYPEILKRRKNDEGTLIPIENCPVWNKWRI